MEKRLMDYRKLKLQIDSYLEQIHQLDDDLQSPKTTQLGRISGGKQGVVTEVDVKIDEKDELYAFYVDKVSLLKRELWQIEQAIDKLPQRENTLLRLYYIQGKTWEQVAEKMNYSVSHIHRLHRKAKEML